MPLVFLQQSDKDIITVKFGTALFPGNQLSVIKLIFLNKRKLLRWFTKISLSMMLKYNLHYNFFTLL